MCVRISALGNYSDVIVYQLSLISVTSCVMLLWAILVTIRDGSCAPRSRLFPETFPVCCTRMQFFFMQMRNLYCPLEKGWILFYHLYNYGISIDFFSILHCSNTKVFICWGYFILVIRLFFINFRIFKKSFNCPNLIDNLRLFTFVSFSFWVNNQMDFPVHYFRRKSDVTLSSIESAFFIWNHNSAIARRVL